MEIIYEDGWILVCYKEAGLPVESGRIGTMDLVNILKNRLHEKNGGNREPYLGVVHRLDQPVEGLLVFAKNRKAAGALSAQVQDDRMKKIYRAVVRPVRSDIPRQGVLENWLLQDRKTNSSRIVPEKTPGAKKARLEYEILSRTGQAALAQIYLFTGRHHQIRVQMAGAGMPLAGDRKYGSSGEHGAEGNREDDWKNGQKIREIPFPALCASSLTLVHPSSGKSMEFHCQPRGEAFSWFPA